MSTLQTAYILHQKSFINLLNQRIHSITEHIALMVMMSVLVVLAGMIILFLSQRDNRHLEAFFKVVIDTLIIVDGKGTIKSVNPAATKIFGHSEAEMLGRNVQMLMMPSSTREAKDGYIEEVAISNKQDTAFKVNWPLSTAQVEIGSYPIVKSRKLELETPF